MKSGHVRDRSLTLSVLGEPLAVCRLDPGAGVPAWATAAPFYSVTRSPDELSVVCPEHMVPQDVASEGGWRALRLKGPFGFGEVGVLASVAAPLAEAGVVMLAIATHDTDYILVKESQLDTAATALRESGHDVHPGEPIGAGTFVIRPATEDDEGFLWEMLAEAARETSVEAVVENPGTARYVEGWGRDGDLGFVAVGKDGEPLGAAWLRLLRGENRGYGYVDDETPELAIAVRRGFRGAGIGARLLQSLLEGAEHPYRSMSLSVRADNPARRLYEKMGFKASGEQDDQPDGRTSITMKINFRENRQRETGEG